MGTHQASFSGVFVSRQTMGESHNLALVSSTQRSHARPTIAPALIIFRVRIIDVIKTNYTPWSLK